MASTFFGLNIAYSGLLASNAALNTTANNISNVQTDGYSRQKVDQKAAEALRTWTTFGSAGAGVQVLAVERIRDEFYDTKYWNNNTLVGEYDMKSYYMKEIEGYLYDSGTNAGFASVFDQLMITGLEELMKNPNTATLKSQFVGYASSLTDYFNNIVGNFENIQKDINQELKLKVDTINSLASEIATLNKQINTVEMGGQNANELRDRRSLLLDELSEIVDVTTSETPVMDMNDPDRETGATRFIVKIAGGQLLVDDAMCKQLECKARENYEKVNQSDIDGLYDIYWGDGQKFNLYNAAMGGALKGLIQMRDGNNGEYFNGTVTDAKIDGYTDANGDKFDTVTVKVTADYLTDLNKLNLSDQGGIINVGNQEFYYDSWTYTMKTDANGNPTYSYTFVLSNDPEKNAKHITTDRVGKVATAGANVNYQGIPYYMAQLNEWVRTFSEKFNDILLSGNDNQGTIMFAGNHATDDEQFQFDRVIDWSTEDGSGTNRSDQLQKLVQSGDPNAANKTVEVNVNADSYYRLTAKNFDILDAMNNDATLMTNRFSLSDGVEQNDLLVALKKMVDEKDGRTFRGGSCAEFLENILSDVALNASSADTFELNYTSIKETIHNTRLSISGVDEDEEAVDLVKYQNSYNLASKMISVFQEIYNKLINDTGV